MSNTTELTTEPMTPIAYCQSMAMAVETMVEWLLKQQQQLSQQQRLLKERQREIEKQQQEIEQLKDSLDKLKNRSSKNSSIPPSSDQLKKPSDKKKRKKGKKRGPKYDHKGNIIVPYTNVPNVAGRVTVRCPGVSKKVSAMGADFVVSWAG